MVFYVYNIECFCFLVKSEMFLNYSYLSSECVGIMFSNTAAKMLRMPFVQFKKELMLYIKKIYLSLIKYLSCNFFTLWFVSYLISSVASCNCFSRSSISFLNR